MGEAPTAPTARSLEDDAKLLDRLQRLSTSILERTRSVNMSVEELARASRVCEVRTRNTLNELLMLCNTQFVENRVYEEEGTDPAEEKSTTETKEVVDVKARWEEALTLGVVALRQKVFYDEDEDEEEEAEDIYNSRPLPLIIGTRAYVASDSAGIGFAEEEDKDDMGEEYGEEEEDEDGGEEEEEGDAEEEEEEEDIYDDMKREEAVEDDVFADDEVAAEDPEEKMPHVPSDIASRIAAQVLHQQQVRADDGPKAPPPLPRAPPPMPESTPDLFAPDDDIFARNDDPYDLFGGKPSVDHPERTDARSLLFGDGGGGLFEEDEEDAPPTSSQRDAATAFAEDPARKFLHDESPTGHPSLGGGLFGDNDLETVQWDAGAKVAKSATKPDVSDSTTFEDLRRGNASDTKINTSSSRFDDLFSSFADDGDFFGDGPAEPFSHDAPAAKTGQPSTTAEKARGGLFEEDDADDIFSSGRSGRKDARKGIDDFFGSSGGGLFDVDNDETADKAGSETQTSGSSSALDNKASTSKGRVIGADKNSTEESALSGDPNVSRDATSKHVTSARGLFDDAEDDDVPIASLQTETPFSGTNGGLFDDEPHAPGKAGSLFDDDSGELIMFGRTQPVSSGDGLFDNEPKLHHDSAEGIFDELQRDERKDSVGSELFGGPKAAAQNTLIKGTVAYHGTGIVAEEVVSGNGLFDTPQAGEPPLAMMPSSSSVPHSAPKNVDTIPPPMPHNSRSDLDERKKLETRALQMPADGNNFFEESATGTEPSRSSGLFDEPAESNANLSRFPTKSSGLFDEPMNLGNTLSSQTSNNEPLVEQNAAAVENLVSAAPSNEMKKGGLGQFADLKIDPTRLLPGAKPPTREHKGAPPQVGRVTSFASYTVPQAAISHGPESTALMRTGAPESTIDTSTIASRPVVAHGKRRPTTKKRFVTEPNSIVPTSTLAVSPANASVSDSLRDRTTTSKPQADNKETVANSPFDSRFEEARASDGLFEDAGMGSSDLFDDPPFGGSSSKGIFADEPPPNNLARFDDPRLVDSASKGLFPEESTRAAGKMGVHGEEEAKVSFAGQSNNRSLFQEPAVGSNDPSSSELFEDEFQKPGFFDDPPIPSKTAAQVGGNFGSLFDQTPVSSIENLDGVPLIADESSRVGTFDNPPSSKAAAQSSKTSGELFDEPQSKAGGLFSDTPRLAGGLFSGSANETGGLFGDDDVGGDNLFSSATSKPPNSANVKKKTGGLFDDDDDLFGSSSAKGGLFG